jgi:hypothetical protein
MAPCIDMAHQARLRVRLQFQQKTIDGMSGYSFRLPFESRQGSSGVDSRVTRNTSRSPGPHLRSVLRVLCRLLNQRGNIGKKRSIIS